MGTNQLQQELQVRNTQYKLEATQKAEIEREQQEEAELRKTGIVDLFEPIRDQKIVVMSNEPLYKDQSVEHKFLSIPYTKTVRVKVCNYTPAVVDISHYPYAKAHLGFNRGYVEAEVSNGILYINHLQVVNDVPLAVAVGNALAHPLEYQSTEGGSGSASPY